jgi:hypothetical protein
MGTLVKPLLLQLQLLSAAAVRSPRRDRAVLAVAALHTAAKPPSIEEVKMRKVAAAVQRKGGILNPRHRNGP